MVKDQQVRRLVELMTLKKKGIAAASAMAGMCEKTAKKYLDLGKLPSETKIEHDWRTRKDPFEDVWDELKKELELNPGLEAKTLFDELQRRYPGDYQDGQLRTLQRKVKRWRATEGPPREVFFPQEHHPGDIGASDFCHMNELAVTIAGQPFQHLLYHFVLTYSNWEWANVCFSESFESLAEGLQGALWELGGVPKRHRSDSLSAAVRKPDSPEEFTRRYQGLLDHYGLWGEKTNSGRGNENGDVEQRHNRIKRAVDQALMLRGSRDFESRVEYQRFLERILRELNAGRSQRLEEERKVLHRLPAKRLESWTRLDVRVGPSSTINVKHITYSVPSRLIGEKVQVRLFSEHLEIWYGQKLIERLPRQRGERGHRIDYRHIIDWLVRKPGAFENYRYLDDLFPTSRFRMAWDCLRERCPSSSERQYLKILNLAAMEGEAKVDDALRMLLFCDEPLGYDALEEMVLSDTDVPPATDVCVPDVDLVDYDLLLGGSYLLEVA